jgi:hypothetical protein
MTRYKNEFDKLTPSEQVAIESMIKNAKADELIDAYKEKIAKDTLKKKPFGFGDAFLVILIVMAIFLFFILPMIEIASYTEALKEAGPAICQAHGSTFVSANFHSWIDVKIICEGFTITLP